MTAMDEPEKSKNALIAMLPASVMERVGHYLVVIPVSPGDVLIEAGEPAQDVFFPLDAVVSLDQVISDAVENVSGAPAVALTGREGVIGIEPFFGGDTSVSRATVRVGGNVVSLDASVLLPEFARAGVFHRLLLRFVDALMAQVAAVGACERVHPIEQRLIRWLLLCDDRAPGKNLGLTQEALSRMLGVRRASISTAASQLQIDGFLEYRRGHIDIIDRSGLEAKSCKCYREISARYRNYLSPP